MLGLKRSFEMQSSSSITMDDEQPFTPQRIRTLDTELNRDTTKHPSPNNVEMSTGMEEDEDMDVTQDDVPPSPCPTSTASSPSASESPDTETEERDGSFYASCNPFYTGLSSLKRSIVLSCSSSPRTHNRTPTNNGNPSTPSSSRSLIPPSPARSSSTLDPEYAQRLYPDGDVRLQSPPGIQRNGVVRGSRTSWSSVMESGSHSYRTPVNSFSSGEGGPNSNRMFCTPERMSSHGTVPSPSRSSIANEYYTPLSSPLSYDRTKEWQSPNLSNARTPTRSKNTKTGTQYSDRFIPSRSSSNLSFSVWSDSNERNSERTPQRRDRQSEPVEEDTTEANRQDGVQNGSSSQVLNALLRSELLGENIDPSSTLGASSSQNMISGSGSASLSNAINSSRPPLREGGNFLRFHQSPRQMALSNVYGSSNCDSSSLLDSFSLSPIKNPNHHLLLNLPQKRKRRISKVPFKVLDAPALADDFYLNLVDWSSLNVLAVGLGSCVYLWSACTSKVTKLCDLGRQPQDVVTSVAWTQRGTYLAVGVNRGEVQIWDVAKCQKIRSMAGHEARIGALAWSGAMLASGSRDRMILLRDVRVPGSCTDRLSSHKQEVCGLKWSFDEPSHLASGGNDNKLLVWDIKKHKKPCHRFAEHTAAVKAIAWSPHQHGLLASGGGTADRCIRFWNALSGTPLNAIDTGSQVCNLAWSQNCNEIVSTHGYSLNQIALWKYPSMQKVATLTGHTYRVLYLAMSPDGSTIVTGAGDETLRFWQVFPGPRSHDKSAGNSLLFPSSPGSILR